MRNFYWITLTFIALFGCFFFGFLFVLAVAPFALILLFFRKIGEKIDGVTWEEQERIIKEKHRASKNR